MFRMQVYTYYASNCCVGAKAILNFMILRLQSNITVRTIYAHNPFSVAYYSTEAYFCPNIPTLAMCC